MSRANQVWAAIRAVVGVAALFSSEWQSVSAAEPRPSKSPTDLVVSVPSTPSVVGANTSTNASYVLAANDLIRVELYKEPDLTTETRVDQDGTVSLPLVQTVKIGGRSVAEAREVIRQLYEKDYLVAAHVNIVLVQTSQTNKAPEVVKPKLRFTILGEVKKPGNLEMPDGEKLDIVRAIAMADGFTGLANKRSVTVNRKGEPKPFTVDVQSLIQDPKAKPFEVKPGDVISVRQTVF